ncbi:MAG: ABC transporter ATP-binding protein, partial [Lachnospiraceae bacterium]|nr:ABC transporter ATP-binding protein [Lachnospiraceae bacterium]
MLRTLGAYVGEYKKDSILTPVCMLFEVLFEMIIPRLMGSIIDSVKIGDLRQIIFYGIVMLVCAGFGLLSGILGAVYASKASAGFAKNLRKGMYDNIQTFSFSNIDKFSTSGLITRLTTDVTNIQNSYQMVLRMCMRAPASLLCAMVMAFSVNARIASIYLVAVIVLGAILFLIIRMAMKYFSQVFKRYDKLNESVQENVTAIRVVKAFARENYEKDKFIGASQNIYRMFVKAESVVAVNNPVMLFTVYACILLISWLGANMIVVGDLSTGQLSTLLAYCMNILMSLMMLSMIFVMLTLSIASGERISEVLEEKADITNPEKPVMQVESGDVVFEHVNFGYYKNASDFVLKDIDLRIQAGETIGIIGGTGSAKSSLVNLISRLYDVTDGSVKVGGRDVREYDLEVLRNEVAVVLQNNVLFSGTILENLRWGNENATVEECKYACELACADEFIVKMKDGYDTYIEQGGSNVSGGQKQRLCIARALLKKPKILILDDSTSAVDMATDAKIREAFAEKIPDTTKFIIAQRISSVEHCDRIIVMEDGGVNGFAAHEEL